MIRCRHLVVLILSSSLAQFISSYAVAQNKAAAPPIAAQSQAPSNATYPQIVRIRYLEGDVRVSRGKEGEKVIGSTWETAVAGLPLATGFNLVTGEGRAEIEFEDASTVYLAENSALSFNDIHTTSGIPYTSIALLSGTATLHVQPMSVAETFSMLTPTDSVSPKYPDESYVRVTSFVDGSEITFLKEASVSVSGSPSGTVKYAKDYTLMDEGHGLVYKVKSETAGPLAAWDAWVDNRVTAREQAEAAMMKESGLTEPIPGLADIQGEGRFFDCAPYGRCWEPNDASDDEPDSAIDAKQAAVAPNGQTPVVAEGAQSHAAVTVPVSSSRAPAIAPNASTVGGHPIDLIDRSTVIGEDGCYLDFLFARVERDRVTGKERVVRTEEIKQQVRRPRINRYGFAVCHAGSWIDRGSRYVWVVGHKRHHHPPVRWVKQGRNIAFVPLHPGDVTGKPPLNLRHPAFAVKDGGKSVELVTLNPKRETTVLDAAPKQFAKPYFEPLAKADDPRVEVHKLGETPVAGKSMGSVLTFDRKSQSFLLERQVTQGNKTTIEREPFDGVRGTLQARVEGMDARGNYSTRSYSGSSSSSNGSGGGSARGGGSGSSAGAGSRSSGSTSGGSRSSGSSGGGSSGSSRSSGGGYSGGGSSVSSAPSVSSGGGAAHH